MLALWKVYTAVSFVPILLLPCHCIVTAVLTPATEFPLGINKGLVLSERFGYLKGTADAFVDGGLDYCILILIYCLRLLKCVEC